jgi:branched-chain amino acid transport system substrate-binding protein
VRRITVKSVAVVGVIGALTLTGCGNDSKKSSNGGLGGGASTGASGGSGKTYKMGFQGALSGDNQQLGINEINAMQLAIDEANASGKYPFKISIVKSDDGGVADKAPAAAAALIQDSQVMGVIGPIFSGPTVATGKAYATAGLGLISPSASAVDLSKRGFTTWHRIVPSDGIEGGLAAEWLAKKYKKVFVVDDTTVYGKGVADVVASTLKSKSVTVTRQGVAQNTQDYGAIAQTVTNSKAQAMFYGGYDAQAGLFAKALKSAGYKGLTMTGNGGKSAVFTSSAGAAGNGWYFSCGCLDATVAPVAKAFNAAYVKKFNTPPSTYSPEAYDATNAMLETYKTAAAGSGGISRKSVADAINKLNYKGITTTIAFRPDGEVSQASASLYEQKNGKIVFLSDFKSLS